MKAGRFRGPRDDQIDVLAAQCVAGNSTDEVIGPGLVGLEGDQLMLTGLETRLNFHRRVGPWKSRIAGVGIRGDSTASAQYKTMGHVSHVLKIDPDGTAQRHSERLVSLEPTVEIQSAVGRSLASDKGQGDMMAAGLDRRSCEGGPDAGGEKQNEVCMHEHEVSRFERPVKVNPAPQHRGFRTLRE